MDLFTLVGMCGLVARVVMVPMCHWVLWGFLVGWVRFGVFLSCSFDSALPFSLYAFGVD